MARDLRLGLNVGYWGAGPPPGIEATIAEAEQLGFDSLWTAEATKGLFPVVPTYRDEFKKLWGK